MQLAGIELALNPSARIAVRDEHGSTGFWVQAPVKAAAFSSVLVDANNFPDAHAFLRSILVEGGSDAQLTAQGAQELLRIGLFAPADALPQAVAYRLTEPAAEAAAAARSQREVEAWLAEPGRGAPLCLPEDWQDRALCFVPHHHGSVWAPAIPPASALSGADGTVANEGPEPAAELDSAETRQQFTREGFAPLADLLPQAHVAELGRYFRELAAEGYLGRDDDGGTRRFIAHNHPVARFWHQQLNERVAQLVGRRTKPSYSFVSAYDQGGDLAWHVDRPPCEYTITVLVDYGSAEQVHPGPVSARRVRHRSVPGFAESNACAFDSRARHPWRAEAPSKSELPYAPLDRDQRSPWALRVRGRDGRLHAVHQRLGEALIFKGRELQHSRDPLPDGHRSTSILFHFVDHEYAGVME